MPALRAGTSPGDVTRPIVIFRPGEKPFVGLARSLLPLQQPEAAESTRRTEARILADNLAKGDLHLRDIAEQIEARSLHPDLIAITGDIAFSGKTNEYDLAQHFFDNLLQVTGLAKDRLFVIPGNHDVDRALISPGAQFIGNELKNRKRAVNVLTNVGDRQYLFRRFQGYAAFIRDYFDGHLIFDDEHYFYTRHLEMEGQNIAILGLNSAWICSSDKDERRKMIVGEPQAWTALEQARNANLRLALLHHPFDQLKDFERKDVEPMLCQGCDFILHGHLHDTGFSHLKNPDAEAIVIAAGACYETRESANSYNLVQLDYATGRGKIILRKWSGKFWTVDATTYQNVPNGEYEFDLPPLLPG